MHMEMLIRKAESSDLSDILTILAQVGALHQKGRSDIFKANLLKYDEKAFLEILADQTKAVFAAADQSSGKVIGHLFCVIREITGSDTMRDARILYIDDLCVDENVRGSGVGKQLLEFAKTYAKEIGCTRVELHVWEFNRRAIAFYEHCGLTTQKRTMEIILGDKI